MLDYLDSITDTDWMIKVLICPICLKSLTMERNPDTLKCKNCSTSTFDRRYTIHNGIPLFTIPPQNKREYRFEMYRYRKIALKPPETYQGFDESYPATRNKFIKNRLGKINEYLNIGQGFGKLEETMPFKLKTCLDQCVELLQYCQKKNIPNTRYVMGFGEQMPFKDNYFPAVISDSVFQGLVDQKEFLVENARVLKNHGKFLLAITYKWNYPRKPQAFPADNPDLLIHFLQELGIYAHPQYLNLKKRELTDYNGGDYLIISGEKR